MPPFLFVSVVFRSLFYTFELDFRFGSQVQKLVRRSMLNAIPVYISEDTQVD